jgi:hypothetical protein
MHRIIIMAFLRIAAKPPAERTTAGIVAESPTDDKAICTREIILRFFS